MSIKTDKEDFLRKNLSFKVVDVKGLVSFIRCRKLSKLILEWCTNPLQQPKSFRDHMYRF